MIMRYRRWISALGCMLLLLALSYPISLAQVSVLNYLDATTGRDNILHIDGTLEFEDKATVIDHGTTTLTAGYKTVTTNLSSNVTCVLTLVKGSTPADDPVALTALHSTGSAVLEILAWKTDGSDPTLVQSTTTSTVGYVCFGAD